MSEATRADHCAAAIADAIAIPSAAPICCEVFMSPDASPAWCP